MNHESQFRGEENPELHHATPATTEFESVEKMIGHDASNVEVPPRVAERLQASLAAAPPASPWWKKIFKKSHGN